MKTRSIDHPSSVFPAGSLGPAGRTGLDTDAIAAAISVATSDGLRSPGPNRPSRAPYACCSVTSIRPESSRAHHDSRSSRVCPHRREGSGVASSGQTVESRIRW